MVLDDDPLAAWLATRAHGCRAVLAALEDRPVVLDDLTRSELDGLARWLVTGLAEATCAAHDFNRFAAYATVATALDAARASLAALAAPVPNYVPAGWCDAPAKGWWPMSGVWVSLALAAPAPSCVDCAGPLPYGPPWLMAARGEPLCARCADRRGHGPLVARVEQARADLAGATDDEQRAKIARDLLAD